MLVCTGNIIGFLDPMVINGVTDFSIKTKHISETSVDRNMRFLQKYSRSSGEIAISSVVWQIHCQTEWGEVPYTFAFLQVICVFWPKRRQIQTEAPSSVLSLSFTFYFETGFHLLMLVLNSSTSWAWINSHASVFPVAGVTGIPGWGSGGVIC